MRKGEHKGRTYIRLTNERDPNTAIIEIVKYPTFS